MKPRDVFLRSLKRQSTPRAAVGSATSIVTTDLMDEADAAFPTAHLDAELMAKLAAAGHTILCYDNVMPLFRVWHESSALSCEVDWETKGRMPDGRPITAHAIHALRKAIAISSPSSIESFTRRFPVP